MCDYATLIAPTGLENIIMNTREALDIINSLPPDKKIEVFDFIKFISGRLPTRAAKKHLNLRDEDAFGLWTNRKDIHDSTTWVRLLREQEWEQQK